MRFKFRENIQGVPYLLDTKKCEKIETKKLFLNKRNIQRIT